MPAEVYNANWFNGNLVRKYPLDSMSSCIDDNGNKLPDDIITDIQISYPMSFGNYCYISAVTVTENIVSVLVSSELGSPLAAVCVERPTYVGRYYTMDSLSDGVVGIIALGLDSISVKGSWRFSSPDQSRVLPKCCSPYSSATVLSISRPSDASPITGSILLTAGNDIKLEIDSINIDGKVQKAIFIGLDMYNDSNRPCDVLAKYITDCDIATESDTCARRYVAGIHNAIPDRQGNLSIVSNSLSIGSVGSGVISLAANLTMDDVCGAGAKRGSEDEKKKKGKSVDYTCPFDSEISEDICSSDSSSAENAETTRRSRSTPVSLYASNYNILQGGVEYDDRPGYTNVSDSGPVEVSYNITGSTVDLSFTTEDSDKHVIVIKVGGAILSLLDHVLRYNESTIATYDSASSLNVRIDAFSATITVDSNEPIVQDITTSSFDTLNLILDKARCTGVTYV